MYIKHKEILRDQNSKHQKPRELKSSFPTFCFWDEGDYTFDFKNMHKELQECHTLLNLLCGYNYRLDHHRIYHPNQDTLEHERRCN